jgi:hypothetical protein
LTYRLQTAALAEDLGDDIADRRINNIVRSLARDLCVSSLFRPFAHDMETPHL